MNAVEIEEAISALSEGPFDAGEFPFAFLQAFGNKETTLKRLRKGESNRSDLGGVLQTNNIHIAVADAGEVTNTLTALKGSSATARAKAKFILATARRSRPKTWRAVRRSPATIGTSRTISASSYRSLGSRPSSRSARTRSTSGPPAG
jgi:hypothetical protein